MSEAGNEEGEVVYHLLLDPDETGIAGRALRLLISDEAHETGIRGIARQVLSLLKEGPGGAGGVEEAASARPGTLSVPLTGPQMKIVHSAVRLQLLDSQRGQQDERTLLREILAKLPDEHAIRAIELP